ncbi:CocE/NonD family hydrolase [Streptomyces canus]|uniref:CocE/NonD family hydrolase n=1 Tax=Streptomyces canus TaxID=58343 RepID=UPI003698FEA5
MRQIEIEFDVPVPMRDGTVLRADVYRPAGEGPFPVIVQRTPYDKSVSVADVLLDFRLAARNGYIVVNQDTRGRAVSDGEWVPWKYEREDGYDTIEWAASLPGSNGKVGMVGGSYLGSTQWSAAISGAPHLVAITPSITWADPADGLLFRGGAIELGVNALWGAVTALGQYPKEGLPVEELMGRIGAAMADIDDLATVGYRELPSGNLPLIVRTGQPDLGVTRALADPATLAESRVSDHYAKLELPSLNIAGWYDIFGQGSLDNYTGMRAHGRVARLIVGPWHHSLTVSDTLGPGKVGEVNFGLAAAGPFGKPLPDVHLEWLDHWLKDGPATSAHESGVMIFVMGVNQWRLEEDWPLARARDTSLYLGEDAALSWESPTDENAESEFTYDPADPVITRGGNLVMSSEFPAGAFDQRVTEERDDVLVFTTPPLEADVEVTGHVYATLFAATDGPSTDWVVRLCDVDENGVSRNIVDGITRVKTDPSRIDEIEVDLWSTSNVFKAGHRIRVQVTSSNFPRWDRNLNTGEPETEGTTTRVAQQRIFHDRSRPSHIRLPIVAD